jgi:hypothetical protein
MAGQQPNFDQVSQAHRILAGEMGLLQNIPAIQGQQQILNQTQRLDNQIQRLHNQAQANHNQLVNLITGLTQLVQGLVATVATMNTRLTAK